MKFELIKDKVQLGHRGYVRHKLTEMPEDELVQRCVLCGQIVMDYRPEVAGTTIMWDENNKIIENYVPKGMGSGYVYVSVEGNPSTIIHEILTQFGVTMPTDFTDCTVINS